MPVGSSGTICINRKCALPCPNPKCKSRKTGVAEIFSLGRLVWYVECLACGTEGTRRISPDAAREVWNRAVWEARQKGCFREANFDRVPR